MFSELEIRGLEQDLEDPMLLQNVLAEYTDTPMDLPELLDRLSLVCVKQTDDDVAKRHFLNLDFIVTAALNEADNLLVPDHYFRLKFTPWLVQAMGVTEDQLFERAYQNMEDSFVVHDMQSLLASFTSDYDATDDQTMMYVCTTKDGVHGAAALLYPAIFREFCKIHELSAIYLIPSSIHELIIIPTYFTPAEVLAHMVLDINNACVPEEIQLDPVIYLYRAETDLVTIAASL